MSRVRTARAMVFAPALLLLAVPPIFAQSAGPLPPGKPAGIVQARAISERAKFIGLALLVTAVGFFMPSLASSTSTTGTGG